MKGIVFTEFLEMVEQTFGIDVADQILNESTLPSEGVYTSVGTYDFVEMQSLLTTLSRKVDIPLDDLIYSYGLYFFKVIYELHPAIFALYKDPIELLSSIESHIHIQVRKLYPGAELPTFKIENKTENQLKILYFSERAMYMFAKALMEKTFEHYTLDADIKMEKLVEDGTRVRFVISKKHGTYPTN